jgi:hypothetical protein
MLSVYKPTAPDTRYKSSALRTKGELLYFDEIFSYSRPNLAENRFY